MQTTSLTVLLEIHLVLTFFCHNGKKDKYRYKVQIGIDFLPPSSSE